MEDILQYLFDILWRNCYFGEICSGEIRYLLKILESDDKLPEFWKATQ